MEVGISLWSDVVFLFLMKRERFFIYKRSGLVLSFWQYGALSFGEKNKN